MGDTAALQLCPGNPWQVQKFPGADAHALTPVSSREKARSLICILCCGSQVRQTCLVLTWPLLYKRPIGFTATLTPCYSCRVDFGPPCCSCVGRTQSFPKGLRMGENISPPQSVKPHVSTIPQPVWPSLHHNLEFLPPGRTSLPPEH